MKTIPFYLLLTLAIALVPTGVQACTVCSKCNACGADVMADPYLDEIDALMQTKVQSLGFPLAINRNASASAIVYNIQYSSGLLIALQLSLDSMQIQLLSYSINNNVTQPTTPTAPPAPVYKTTPDGYYILENFANSTQVSEIMNYLTSVLRNNLTNFQLVSVQFTNNSALLYRLAFRVLPVSSPLVSIVQTVFVQYVGPNNCLLIDSNYTNITAPAWTNLDNKAILTNPFLSAINTLLVRKYANLLGSNPTIVSLAQALPYYQMVYRVDSTNYSFIVLYDYFQNRILQGNLTTSKTTTTSTQAQPTNTAQAGFSSSTQSTTTNSQASSQVSSSQSSSSSSSTLQVSSYSPNAGTQTFYNGNAVVSPPTVSVNVVASGTPTYYTVSNRSSASSNSTISQGQSNPSPTPTITQTANTPSSSSSSSSATTSSASTSTASTSSASSSSQTYSVPPVLTPSASSSAQNASYQQIAHFQSSPEVISALGFLSTQGQNISMSQVQSVQKMINGSVISYLITIQLSSLGSVAVSKNIFYQYVLQLTAGGIYSIQQASYNGLNPPNFVVLTLQEVKKDENIKLIARYLLSQQFPMLSSNSQVLAVYRDIPYYQIVFQGISNRQLTFIILFGFNGDVQVMSATSRQVTPPQQTFTQAAAQAAANGQTSITTQSSQSSQATQTSQTSQNVQGTQTTAQSQVLINQNSQAQVTQSTNSSQTAQNRPTQAQVGQATQTSQTVSQQNQNTIVSQSNQNTVQPILQQIPQNQSQSSSGQGTSTVSQASQQSEPVFVQIRQVQNNTTSPSQSTSNTGVTSSQSTNTAQVRAASNTSSSTSTSAATAATMGSTTTVMSSTGAQATSNTASNNQTTSTSSQSTAATSTSNTTASSNSANGQSQTTSSTTKNASTQSSPSNSGASSTSLGGYNHFGGSQDQFYPYALQGIAQINQTLASRGYNISQLVYKDIVYKLEGNILTILYKVEVAGLLFTYQYKGSIGSSYMLTSSALPAAVQTSSDTQSYSPDANTIVSGGITYQTAPSSLVNQAYVQSYLNFLATSDICYSRSNLVGIYVNPNNPNTLFFRFRNSTQFYNIVTNTVQIQRILSIYLSESSQQSSSTASNASNTKPSATAASNISLASTSTASTNGQSTSQMSTQSTQMISGGANQQASSTAQQQGSSTQQRSSTQQGSVTTQQASQTVNQAQVSSNQAAQTTQSSNIQQSQTSQTSTIFQNTQKAQSSQTSSSSGSQTNQNTQSVQTAPIKSSQITTINVDPQCLCYDQGRCLKCAHRFYLSNNKCIQVPNQCLSYDINSGVCVKCLPGYSILNGLCQLDDVTAYYYEGQCFQCLGDYRLVNRKCVYAPITDPKSPQFLQTKNPLCLGWKNGVCDECLPGTYLSSRQVCELVDPFCSLFDYTREMCNTCFEGYTVRNGKCFIL